MPQACGKWERSQVALKARVKLKTHSHLQLLTGAPPPFKPQIRELELIVRVQILDIVVRKGACALFDSRGKCNVHLEL